MKYKDRNTLLIQSKHQKESNDYGFPLESNREVKRRRKKELKEFWSKSLRGHLSEDFWNLLDMNEQSSVSLLSNSLFIALYLVFTYILNMSYHLNFLSLIL